MKIHHYTPEMRDVCPDINERFPAVEYPEKKTAAGLLAVWQCESCDELWYGYTKGHVCGKPTF